MAHLSFNRYVLQNYRFTYVTRRIIIPLLIFLYIKLIVKTWWWHNPSLFWVFLCDNVLKRLRNSTLCIGECPSIAPFLENNGPRPRKGPRYIVFKEWNDTRTFAYIKSTHRLQTLPQYMQCINLLPYITNYSVHVSIHFIYHIYPLSLVVIYFMNLK